MVTKKQERQIWASVFGILGIVFLFGLLIVGLSMIGNFMLFLQTSFGLDEFGSQLVTFIILLIGLVGFTYMGMAKYTGKR